MAERLFQVTSRDFCAGFIAKPVADEFYVTSRAPILRRLLSGKQLDDAIEFCRRRGWSCEEVKR